MDVWNVSREGGYRCLLWLSGAANTLLMLLTHTSLYLAQTQPRIGFRPYGRMWCRCDGWTFGRLRGGLRVD